MGKKKTLLGIIGSDSKPISPSNQSHKAVSSTEVYRDVNRALGKIFNAILSFFDIKVPGMNAPQRHKSRKKKKGLF